MNVDVVAVRVPCLDAIVDIEPSSGLRPLNLRELWSYRELLYFLA